MHRILLAVAVLSSIALGQDPIQRIIGATKDSPKLEENLRVLTDEIGGRVPGTPGMDRAIQWATTNFKDAGADSVRTEQFQMPLRWTEGDTQVEVLSPARFRARAVSMAWAPPYSAASVEFSDVGEGDAAGFSGARPGTVVLVHTETMKKWDDLFAEYMRIPGIIDRSVKAKATGIAFISTRERDLLYRHLNTSKIAPLPMVILAREDGERIGRLLTRRPVRARFSVHNKVGAGFPSSNVIAEIRGAELPHQYVILGAHLDSWELGTGALDNGCNAAMVIEALRAIKKSGVRPRRTILFILYSGEEQGMIGSREWERAHRKELENVIADIVFDTGSGRFTGYSLGGRKDVLGELNRLMSSVPGADTMVMTTDAFVGTDNLHLLLQGIPTLVANQKEDNYLENYHASSDTFDKVNFTNLREELVMAAATAFAIADAPERVGKRQSPREVDALVKETGLDEQMRAFDLIHDWEEIRASRGH